MKKWMTTSIASKLSPLLFLLLNLFGFALSAQQLSYHGRIVDSATNVGVNGAVDFRIQIRTPITAGANCIMYEENQVKSLNNGVFVISLNTGLSSGPSGATTNVYSVQEVFSNKNAFGAFSFPAANCLAGPTIWAPSATDGRRINISFHDGSMAVGVYEPLPVQTVAFVPSAIESINVGGFPSNALVRVVNGGVPDNILPLSNVEYAQLLTLIAGNASLGGDVTGTQSATVVSKIQGKTVSAAAPAMGQVLKYVGGVWQPAADNDSGGTVTNVTSANNYLTVTSGSTVPLLTLNVGNVANIF